MTISSMLAFIDQFFHYTAEFFSIFQARDFEDDGPLSDFPTMMSLMNETNIKSKTVIIRSEYNPNINQHENLYHKN